MKAEHHTKDLEAESAWEQELLARIRAIDEGVAFGISYEEVSSQAEKLMRDKYADHDRH